MKRLEPLKFRPALREKIWGSRDIRPLEARCERPVGEAWCLNDSSAVSRGPLEGRTVSSLVTDFGHRLMGSSWQQAAGRGIGRGSFPIVAKLLFGEERLSIQVHPDDTHAMRLEGCPGKTELWYVMSAGPEGRLGLGPRRSMDRMALAAAARDGSIESELRWLPARAGECVLVPAGTVHSLRGGVVLCEIQQNSDITYRLFDYRRPGLDGELRPLQIERAVAVANTRSRPDPGPPREEATEPCRVMHLGRCPFFAAELLEWNRPFLYLPDAQRCHLLLIVRGFGSLSDIPFEAGDAFLIPAEAARFPVDGWEAQAVRAYLP